MSERKTEMYLTDSAAPPGMVRVRQRADGVTLMGDHPEPCENEPYCHYDRAIFASCPCCAAIAQSFVREQDARLQAAMLAATADTIRH